MKSLIDQVRSLILRNRMIEPGDKVLTAVSGGADSVSLIHGLFELKDELKFNLCIAHLNHQARGKDSDEDAQFVRRLGESLGVETILDSIDARKESEILKTSFQEGARILRYRFLESAMKKCKGNKIAVGHNADDSVETVLINLLRGSGMKGLSGIPPVRGNIIRPLLTCSRLEIEDFLKSRQLTYRCDRTNAETDYLRNKIRLDLIPKLENEYSRNIKSHILNTAEIIREEDDYLDNLEWLRAYLRKNGNDCTLEQEKVRRLHPAMRRRVVRLAIAEVLGGLRRITVQHVDDVLKLVGDPWPGKQAHLPEFLVVSCNEKELVFSIKPKPSAGILKLGDSGEGLIELNIPGVTKIPSASLSLRTQVVPGGEYCADSSYKSYLDFEKTGGRIHVRFFRPGDRFAPLGMTGFKKVKSFFIDEKVPRDKRKTLPILTTSFGDIIWIYGMRIANNYRVTLETNKVLCIEGIPDK
jgi:tRNA(Ile)-lysidine synthase